MRTELVVVHPGWMPGDFQDASAFRISVIRRGKGLSIPCSPTGNDAIALVCRSPTGTPA